MKKVIKKLTAAVMGLVMIASLAGCGGNNGTSSPDPKTAETKETGDNKSEDKSGGTKEVTIWHYFEHEAEALEAVANAYNEKQDDIHITCTFVSREELMKQYTIGAVSGELPDIGMVDSPDMASYISLGVFEDITSDIENWDELKNFYEGPLSSCKDADGKIYGLPNNSNCLALACNMDVLKAAGFDAPPKTWDEFYEICKATTNKADSVYGFAMSAVGTEEGTFQFIPWLYSAGATINTLDSPEAANALGFLSKLVAEGLMSKEVANWTQGDAYNAFCAGKAAMYEAGTWQIATIDDDVNKAFEYKFAELPKSKQNATVIGGENFGVCVGSDAKEECVEFLKYMMSAQNNADWAVTAGKLPVRSDAVGLNDTLAGDERYAVFNESMKFAVARGPHEQWPTISETLYTAEQYALLGEKSAADAMAGAASVVKPILAEKPIAE